MKKNYDEFIFESESRNTDGLCNQIRVTIDFNACMMGVRHVEDCSLTEAELELFDDTANELIKLDSFPEIEQRKIFKKAESIFNDSIDELFFEKQIAAAENKADFERNR